MQILKRLRELTGSSFNEYYNFLGTLADCASNKSEIGDPLPHDKLLVALAIPLEKENPTKEDLKKINDLVENVKLSSTYSNLKYRDNLEYAVRLFKDSILTAIDENISDEDYKEYNLREKNKRHVITLDAQNTIKDMQQEIQIIDQIKQANESNQLSIMGQKYLNSLIAEIGDLGLQLRRQQDEYEKGRGTALLNLAIRLRILADNYFTCISKHNDPVKNTHNFLCCLRESIYEVTPNEELTLAKANEDIARQKIRNLKVFLDSTFVLLSPLNPRNTRRTDKQVLEALAESLEHNYRIGKKDNNKEIKLIDPMSEIKFYILDNSGNLNLSQPESTLSRISKAFNTAPDNKPFFSCSRNYKHHIRCKNYKDYRKALEYQQTLKDLYDLICVACEQGRLPVYTNSWHQGGISVTLATPISNQETKEAAGTNSQPKIKYQKYRVPHSIDDFLSKIDSAYGNDITFEEGVATIYKRLVKLCMPYEISGKKPSRRYETSQEFYGYCKSYIEFAHSDLCASINPKFIISEQLPKSYTPN